MSDVINATGHAAGRSGAAAPRAPLANPSDPLYQGMPLLGAPMVTPDGYPGPVWYRFFSTVWQKTCRDSPADSTLGSVAGDASQSIAQEQARAQSAEANLQNQVNTLNGEVSNLQNQINNLQNEVSSLTSRVSTLEGQLNGWTFGSAQIGGTLPSFAGAFITVSGGANGRIPVV